MDQALRLRTWFVRPLPKRITSVVGVTAILATLATIFYVNSRPDKGTFGPEHDFVTVITGAHCAVDSCDPYDSPTLERQFAKMGGYVLPQHFKPEWPVYPPSTFLLLLPLSLLPWPVLAVLWMLLSFAFIAAAFVALFLTCKAYRDVLSLLPFVILLADGSIAWAVVLGQPTLIAAASLTLAILALEAGSTPILGGTLLAITLLLKPQGAYLCAAYFLIRSRTRIPAVAACAVTAGAAAAGILLYSVRLSSFAYLAHLRSNLALALQPGRDADFSLVNRLDSASFLNLQAFLARLMLSPRAANQLTYATCLAIALVLVFVCWRKKNLASRPYTILAILIMLELLVSYHRLYDHALMLAAIPGLYEIKQRGVSFYLLFVTGLFAYHFSQFHGLIIHGLGPFPSGPPVELLIAAICLTSLWMNQPQRPG